MGLGPKSWVGKLTHGETVVEGGPETYLGILDWAGREERKHGHFLGSLRASAESGSRERGYIRYGKDGHDAIFEEVL